MEKILVGVVMGSNSDWDTLQQAVLILQRFGIPHEARVVSAHRMPDDMFAYAEAAAGRGLQAIIAGAGGAAHLPGMIAAKTVVPVLGVPVQTKALFKVAGLLMLMLLSLLWLLSVPPSWAAMLALVSLTLKLLMCVFVAVLAALATVTPLTRNW